MKNILLSMSLFFSLMSCMSYYKVQKENPISSATLSRINSQNKYFILHKRDSAWHLSIRNSTANELSGNLTTLPAKRWKFKTTKMHGGSRYKNTWENDESYVLQEVHLYLNPEHFPGLKAGDNITISYNDVVKADLYKKDKGRTTVSWLIPGIGISAVIVLLTTLVVTLGSGMDGMGP